jgi:hypothetical protein
MIVYTPAAAVVTFVIEGFCNVEVNPLGPVQEYEAPVSAGVVRFSVAPAHNGPLFAAVGDAGIAFTTTVVVPARLWHPFTVILTE